MLLQDLLIIILSLVAISETWIIFEIFHRRIKTYNYESEMSQRESDMLIKHASEFKPGERVFLSIPLKCNSTSLTKTYKRDVFDFVLPADHKGTVVGADGIRLIVALDGLPIDIAIDPFVAMRVMLPEDGNA